MEIPIKPHRIPYINGWLMVDGDSPLKISLEFCANAPGSGAHRPSLL